MKKYVIKQCRDEFIKFIFMFLISFIVIYFLNGRIVIADSFVISFFTSLGGISYNILKIVKRKRSYKKNHKESDF